jgi:hypothetical protein
MAGVLSMKDRRHERERARVKEGLEALEVLENLEVLEKLEILEFPGPSSTPATRIADSPERRLTRRRPSASKAAGSVVSVSGSYHWAMVAETARGTAASTSEGVRLAMK